MRIYTYKTRYQKFHTYQNRKENPQKLTQLSSRSHSRHLMGKKTAQKDTTIDIASDSQVNSNFPYRWSLASLTFNNYFYLFLAHLSQRLRVSYCHQPMSVVRRATCVVCRQQLLQTTSPLKPLGLGP